MNEMDLMLAAMARLLERHFDDAMLRSGRSGEWSVAGWGAIEDMALPLAMVDEGKGGLGLGAADAMALVRLAASHGVSLPIGETMIANQALARGGLRLADGAAAIIPVDDGLRLRREKAAWRLSGIAHRVPDGRNAATLVCEAIDGDAIRLVRVRAADVTGSVARATNLAAMARDTIMLDCVLPDDAVSSPCAPALQFAGAALRAVQVAGALDHVLQLTITYANERTQFGRAIGKFQAVQHEVARGAGEVAAAGAAADLAIAALDRAGTAAALAIAAARVRSGEAAGKVAAIAHQVHGAIGFTVEHRLHLFTSAALAWRDEFGADRYWVALLGEAARAAGPEGLWPMVTAA